jgi:hypothetical protein
MQLAWMGLMVAVLAPAYDTSDLETAAPEIAKQVSALRSLPLKAPLTVKTLADAPFSKAVHESARKNAATLADPRAAWIAFGFFAPSADVAAVVDGVNNEQLLGFYDPGSHALYLRATPPASSVVAGVDMKTFTLAHEIEHGLQDEHFGLSGFLAIADDDARLAARGLYEGEATLVALAYIVQQAGKPVRQSLLLAAQRFRDVSPDLLVRLAGGSDALLQSSAILREAMIFSYFAGLNFAVSLYQVGGFALLDKAFAHPPQTTEQVLHPTKYVAGELAIPVRTPTVPPGYKRVAQGTLGELGTRAFLSTCLSGSARVKAAASGWGGDAYAVGEGEGGALALFYSTVWDDEAHAATFERSLREVSQCWKAPATSKGRRIGAASLIKRDGAKVALVRGLPASVNANEAVASLLALPQAKLAEAPPLGKVSLPPEGETPPELLTNRGKVELNAYTSEWLNMKAEVPAGFNATTTSGTAELVVQRKQPSLAMGMFIYGQTAATAEGRDGTLAAISSALANVGHGAKVVKERGGDVDLGWAKGIDQEWRLEGTALRIRAIVLPACAGKAMFTYAELWMDQPARALLDRWIGSFQPRSPDLSKACKEAAAAPPPPK